MTLDPKLYKNTLGKYIWCGVAWDKVSDEQKLEYFNLTRILMSSILPPLEAIHCKNTNCTNNFHMAATEYYYDQIVDSLLKASTSLSQNKPSSVRKNPVIPNSNQNVKAAHAAASQSYLNWIKLQKPTAGLAYENTINSRKIFKYALRKTKSMNDQLFADNIAASLISGQSSPNFWKHINLANNNKYKTPVSTCVNGQTIDQNITNMWEDHYKSLMNFPEIKAESEAKHFAHQTLSTVIVTLMS